MIDFSQVLYAVDGKTALRTGEKDAPELTLRDVAVMALVRPYDDERNLPPQKTFERGVLAQRIQRAQRPLKLRSEEVSQLKDLIAKAFGPAVTVAAWPMLDPAMKIDEEDDGAAPAV